MRRRSQPPTTTAIAQQRIALHQRFCYLRIDLVPVGVVVQKEYGGRKGRHEHPHGAMRRVAVGVDVIHYATDEEWLVRDEEPHPQHEQYARYAVQGTEVGQTPQLVVIGAAHGDL